MNYEVYYMSLEAKAETKKTSEYSAEVLATQVVGADGQLVLKDDKPQLKYPKAGIQVQFTIPVRLENGSVEFRQLTGLRFGKEIKLGFGGAVDAGEDLTQAAVRELMEELGLDASEYTLHTDVVEAGKPGQYVTFVTVGTLNKILSEAEYANLLHNINRTAQLGLELRAALGNAIPGFDGNVIDAINKAAPAVLNVAVEALAAKITQQRADVANWGLNEKYTAIYTAYLDKCSEVVSKHVDNLAHKVLEITETVGTKTESKVVHGYRLDFIAQQIEIHKVASNAKKGGEKAKEKELADAVKASMPGADNDAVKKAVADALKAGKADIEAAGKAAKKGLPLTAFIVPGEDKPKEMFGPGANDIMDKMPLIMSMRDEVIKQVMQAQLAAPVQAAAMFGGRQPTTVSAVEQVKEFTI
jgi:ADP-ribose pyrophosphatase YjhB (NUDIX family)